MRKITAYAPVSIDGTLYTDECMGDRKEQFRVYRTEETAQKHKVFDTDRIIKVSIEVDYE